MQDPVLVAQACDLSTWEVRGRPRLPQRLCFGKKKKRNQQTIVGRGWLNNRVARIKSKCKELRAGVIGPGLWKNLDSTSSNTNRKGRGKDFIPMG